MAIFKMQIALPDRPGSLGAVASAIGFAGGDIRSLVTVKRVRAAKESMTSLLQFQVVIQPIYLKY